MLFLEFYHNKIERERKEEEEKRSKLDKSKIARDWSVPLFASPSNPSHSENTYAGKDRVANTQ